MLHLHKKYLEENKLRVIKAGARALGRGLRQVPLGIPILSAMTGAEAVKSGIKVIKNSKNKLQNAEDLAYSLGVSSGGAATGGLAGYGGYKLVKDKLNKKKETKLDKIKDKIKELKNKD